MSPSSMMFLSRSSSGSHAQALGDHVQLRLDGEGAFGHPQPAQLGAAHLVGVDEGGRNPEVVNAVGAVAVLHGAVAGGQALGVGAGVPEKVDVPGRQRPVLHDPGLDRHRGRGRAGRGGELLRPGHYHLHGLAAAHGQRHRHGLQPRLDLAAEAAAYLGVDHPACGFPEWRTARPAGSGAETPPGCRSTPSPCCPGPRPAWRGAPCSSDGSGWLGTCPRTRSPPLPAPRSRRRDGGMPGG